MRKQCVDGCDRCKSCRSNHVTTLVGATGADIKSFHGISQRGRTNIVNNDILNKLINFQCPRFNTRYYSIGL